MPESFAIVKDNALSLAPRCVAPTELTSTVPAWELQAAELIDEWIRLLFLAAREEREAQK